MEVRNKRNENQTHPTSKIPNSSFAAAARYNNDNSDFRIFFVVFVICVGYTVRATKGREGRSRVEPRGPLDYSTTMPPNTSHIINLK